MRGSFFVAGAVAALLAGADAAAAPREPMTADSGTISIIQYAGACPRRIVPTWNSSERNGVESLRFSQKLGAIATGVRLMSAKPVEHGFRFEGTLRPPFANCEGFGERVLSSVLNVFTGAYVAGGDPVVTGASTR